MNYSGFTDFFAIRSKGVIPSEGQLMSPPFIIWSAEDDGFEEMINITSLFWGEFSLPKYWQELIDTFSYLYYEHKRTEPLSIEERSKLKKAAFKYFANPNLSN